MAQVLVTGGGGFLGSAITDALAERSRSRLFAPALHAGVGGAAGAPAKVQTSRVR